MERSTKSVIYTVAFGFIAAILLLMPIAANYTARSEFMNKQQNILVLLQNSHPEWVQDYLEVLYSEDKHENSANATEEILLRYGYSDGLEILEKRIFPVKQLAGLALFSLVATGLLFILIRKKTKIYREELREQNNNVQYWKNKAEEIAYHKQQNQRLVQFIENIAHQIRTPLSRTMTALECAEQNLNDMRITESATAKQSDEKSMPQLRIKECLEHIDGVRQLITRLLQIGRMEAGTILFQKDTIDLFELLADTANGACGEKEYRVSGEMEDCIWSGDYEWLREAFGNILRNCAEHDSSAIPLEIGCKKEKEYYQVEIRDHGSGLYEEDIPHLFDRFYQTKTEKKGHVGIGLNLAKLIIEGHHGTIRATNHPEGGAYFTVMLPRYSVLK